MNNRKRGDRRKMESGDKRALRFETFEKRHLLAASLGFSEFGAHDPNVPVGPNWAGGGGVRDSGIVRSVIPGQLVVALEHDEPIENVIDFVRTTDLAKVESFHWEATESLFSVANPDDSGRLTLVTVGVDPAQDVTALAGELSTLNEIAWAAPNYRYTGDIYDFVPNDPDFNNQYHHTLIGNDLAWDVTLGDPSVIIAVTDNGVDLNHPDLAGNIWVNDDPIDGIDNDGNGFVDDLNGWDFVAGDNDPNPNVSGDDHGTHVAGIAAGITNNAVGISGTAGGATIMPLRIAGNDGGFTSTIMAGAFAYAIDNGAKIANTPPPIEKFNWLVPIL